jgi:nitroreductase
MCRKYSDRDVPQEKLDRILDLASRYPSAGHMEPQEFSSFKTRRRQRALAGARCWVMTICSCA